MKDFLWHLQNIYASDTNLNESQRRVVHKYLLEARLNGIELSTDNSNNFTTKLKKLENEKDTFRRKVAVRMHTLKVLNCEAFANNCVKIFATKVTPLIYVKLAVSMS